jgi:hypothetical protein
MIATWLSRMTDSLVFVRMRRFVIRGEKTTLAKVIKF